MVGYSYMKKLIVIDGNAIVHRAYHALPPMTTKDGKIVHAAYGFTSLLLKLLNEYKPDALCVTFDVKGGTFRDDLYSEYKATRVEKGQDLYDQFDYIREILDSADIPYYEKKGFEADDVIGTITHLMASKKDWKTIVVTGDTDELQLVAPGTDVMILRKGITDVSLFDEKAVKEKYGLTPLQLIDFKALKGDTSDNIKGVKGIGEKTALDLIQRYGSVENLYKELMTGTLEGVSKGVKQKLEDGTQDAILSKQLVTIVRDVPINFDAEKCKVEIIPEKVAPIFRDYEFTSLLKRLPNPKKEETTIVPVVEEKQETISAAALKKIAQSVKEGDVLLVQEVAQGELFNSTIANAALATNEGVVAFEVNLENVSIVKEILEKNVVTFDAKKLMHVISLENVKKFSVVDVMLLSYLLQAGREITIEDIVYTHTGEVIENTTPLTKKAELLRVAYPEIKKQVEDEKQWDVYETYDAPLLPVLYMMEKAGITLDVKKLARLSVDATKEIEKISKKIWKLAGREFNISSPQQLSVVLFDELGLPTMGIKRGKTGISTAASELEKLQGQHEIIDYISEYRELTKLQSTYIDALPRLIDGNQKLHTTFSQTTAATGRLASNNPNLQNIPVRTELGKEVRSCITASKGKKLLSIDYSQFELRIAAHVSEDDVLIKLFKEGKDIHTSTAAVIHGIKESEVTPEIRRSAKEVNFGVLYGMGAFGLSQRTGLTRFAAAEFIEKYFATFKKLAQFIEETTLIARKNGYASTLYGRRRKLPDLHSTSAQVRAAAERMAINMPIQGTQADIIKKAMVDVQRVLENRTDIVMLLQIHDELVFEVDENKVDEAVKLLKPLMENAAKLKVPIIVEAKVGDNWSDTEKL